MNYTDTQLKQALAKMLPEKLAYVDTFYWRDEDLTVGREVLDTELLHLCWLVEETLTEDQQSEHQIHLYCLFDENWTYEELVNLCFELSWRSTRDMSHATWQQRVIALTKVKGITT